MTDARLLIAISGTLAVAAIIDVGWIIAALRRFRDQDRNPTLNRSANERGKFLSEVKRKV
jgi:hypothetical protein